MPIFAAVFRLVQKLSWRLQGFCLFSSVGQSTWFVISGSLVRIRQEAQNRAGKMTIQGCFPEWPNGADCKSAVFRLRWFESISTHEKTSCGNSSVDRALAFQAGGRGFESRFPLKCCYSSVVEHFLGKEEVLSSSLSNSSLVFRSRNYDYSF